MAVHDWTRVEAGIFHDFHLDWIFTLKQALNQGILPPDFYALAEQVAGGLHPDVFALVLGKRITIRHSSDDRMVTLLEIVSPGNKGSQHALRSFTEKAWELLDAGIHLLILDLLPPGPCDPQGIHAVIWSQTGDTNFQLPADKPLTLVSYAFAQAKEAYLEPVAVGDVLPEMPLFLEPDRYVLVPLEATYRAAFDAVPRRWRTVLEAAGEAGR
jgi:hypothetical protein